jgi:hypothetical protein
MTKPGGVGWERFLAFCKNDAATGYERAKALLVAIVVALLQLDSRIEIIIPLTFGSEEKQPLESGLLCFYWPDQPGGELSWSR